MGGGGSRRYDWETKVAASRDHVENGLTKTEAMARHGIASIAYLKRWCRDYRSGGAQAETQGQAERREIQTEARTDARAGARRTGRVPEGEGRVPGKTPGPAGVQVTRRERSAVVRLLAGRGHRLGHLLRIAGLPKSTYYHHLSRPAHVSRPDVEPMVREIWDAVPAPMVAGRARMPRHPPVHEPQGQLPGQRGGRAGLRPLEGRVLPRPCVDSYEQFKRELDAYIIHWNTRRRQIRLEGRTPEEFRSMSLAV